MAIDHSKLFTLIQNIIEAGEQAPENDPTEEPIASQLKQFVENVGVERVANMFALANFGIYYIGFELSLHWRHSRRTYDPKDQLTITIEGDPTYYQATIARITEHIMDAGFAPAPEGA